MMEVVYVGSADIRELSTEDFDRMGAGEHKDMVFHRGMPEEVSNKCGEALLGHDLIAGEFIDREKFDADKEAKAKLLAAINPEVGAMLVDPAELQRLADEEAKAQAEADAKAKADAEAASSESSDDGEADAAAKGSKKSKEKAS